MIRILLITLLVATAPVRLFADDTGLYTGAVAVASQGAAERREALPQALAHVLRKLSGARDLEAVPGIEDALQGASALLVSFYYRTVEHPMPDGAVREELRLLARFAEPGVDDLVRQVRLPLWPPQRRPAEVWLVIDDGDGRHVLPAEFDYLRFAVDDAASLRGLPLRWPQADEEGMYPVSGLADLDLTAAGLNLTADDIHLFAKQEIGVEWVTAAEYIAYGAGVCPTSACLGLTKVSPAPGLSTGVCLVTGDQTSN